MRRRSILLISLLIVGIASIAIAGREYIWIQPVSPTRGPESPVTTTIAKTLLSANTPVVFAGREAHELARLCPGSDFESPVWRPEIGKIRAVERALKPLLASGGLPVGVSDLSKYVRQYVGVYLQGKQMICLSASTVSVVRRTDGFCAESVRRELDDCYSDSWRREVISVEDGGLGFWRILYDPETGEFSHFEANGVA